METGKGKGKLSHPEGDFEERESPQFEGAGGDNTEFLSKFAREGIELLKRDTNRLRKEDGLTPGIEKSLRGVVEKYLSEWRKKKGDKKK